jgi:anti-sigma regulatory factor (Ser/Thr protein kinase)
LTASATEPPRPSIPPALWIRGGKGAPARARAHLQSHLEGDVSRARAADAALIVSELVTNSVIHADVGIHQVVCLQLTTVGDTLRIAVTDSGSELEPRLVAADPATPGGLGLRLVDRLCSAWGVERDTAGATRVWCDLRLDRGLLHHGQR